MIAPSGRIQHAFVERQIREPADRLHRRRRIGHEVLVSHLEVVARAEGLSVADRGTHEEPPLPGSRPRCARSPRPGEVAERHVAPVTDQVDEPGVGPQRVQERDMASVFRCLVPPARLPVLIGVREEGGLHHVGERRLLERSNPLPYGGFGHLPVPEVRRSEQHRREGLGIDGVRKLPPERGYEVRLARHRELRVRVQHQADQRGTRAAGANDEQWRPARRGAVAHGASRCTPLQQRRSAP